MKTIIAVLRMLAFVAGTLLTAPFILLHKAVTGSTDSARFWHAMACRVFNIKVVHVGEPRACADTPTVFLSNHLSYLDIVIIGARLRGIFVAKSEVAQWPVFGFLAKIQNTIFIVRTRYAMEDSKNKIGAVLKQGHDVILFGEGTISDGRSILPFKAGLLEAVYDSNVGAKVQPTTIVINSVDGKNPDDQAVRDLYTWWRLEETLAPHLWRFARAGGAILTVHYLPVLDPADFPDRKSLARAAHESALSVL